MSGVIASRKVCILTSVHPVFDVRIFHKQGKTLARAGYDVTLIAQHERNELVDGVRIIGLPKPRNRFQRILALTWRVFHLALKQNATIHHFHDPELLPWGWLLQKVTHKPVIYDVHEYIADDILTKDWIPNAFRYLICKSMDKLEKLIATRLGGIVTVNNHMETLFKKNNASTVTIHNYPILRFAKSFTFDLETEPSMIVYVGTTSKIHGYQIMVEAMRIVRNENPKAKCVIVGQVDRTGLPQDFLNNEDKLLRDGGMNLMGRVPYEEIPQLLSRMTVAWIPWLAVPNNVKGTPTKLFEYMAAGLPIVASRMQFLNEIIEESGCGMLIDPNDPNAHAEAVLYLLHHPEEAKRMGHNGRKAIFRKYNWEEESKKLLDFYSRLVTN